jgi:hypothetical protein
LGFLSKVSFLIPLQSVTFWGLILAFTIAYNVKVLFYGYQSIDIQCIVLSVKFDGGLFISVLRNKQLFTKKRAKSLHFQIFEKTVAWAHVWTAHVWTGHKMNLFFKKWKTFCFNNSNLKGLRGYSTYCF